MIRSTTRALPLAVAALLLGILPAPSEATPRADRVSPADTLGPVVTGQIRAPGYRGDGFLPGALVELRQEGRAWTVVADAAGRYRLPAVASPGSVGRVRGPEPGRVRLSVFHVAAEALVMELLLPPTGEVRVDLELTHRPVVLAGVEVGARTLPEVALRRTPFPVAEPRLGELALRALEASPGMMESGLARGMVRAPPGEEHREPERILFARGSTVDARQFLLDGAPILAPFHLAGLVPAFDPRALDQARSYVGGAPARYEGGLSHVLDVTSREARRDRLRGEVAVDGVALRGGVELPLPLEGGALGTGRILHGAPHHLSTGGEHPYGFGDLLLRGAIHPASGHVLRGTGFLNRESVRLQETDRVEWGNRAGSLAWAGRWGEVETETLLARSSYRAALPVEWPEALLARSVASHARGAFHLRAPWGEGVLSVGASVERQDFGYRLDRVEGAADARGESGPGPGLSAPGTVTEIQSAPEELRSHRVGVFLEAERSLRPGIRLVAGGRADHFGVDGSVRLAPRASLAVLLTDDALLTLSGGRYHQAVALPGLAARPGSGTEAPAIAWNPTLAVASASHLVLSLDQSLSPDLSLGVSGFIKNFEGAGDRGPGGRVNASGTDLRVGWDGERVEGWAGYAISWFWEPSGNGRSSSFTGRHLLTTGLRARPWEGWELGVSLGYGAGLPLVDVTLASGAPQSPDGVPERLYQGGRSGSMDAFTGSAAGAPLELPPEDAFLRLDLEVAWEAHPRIAGRTTELRPYLRVINALDRRDALFHYLDRWMDDGIRPLAERPFLPLLGVEWRF